MKFTDHLKKQAESAPAGEEKKETVRQADMLRDDDLDQVSGGAHRFLGCFDCPLIVEYGNATCSRCEHFDPER